MIHPTEDELVLLHYGEAEDAARLLEHLETCGECRASYEALRGVLGAVSALDAPERGPDYERAVWERVRAHLQVPAGRKVVPLRRWRRLVPAAAVAASLVLAFLLGRHSLTPERHAAEAISAPARERILLLAVGDHLERSQMLLVELVNAQGDGSVSIAAERRRAEELVPANRLYRQAAARAGDNAVAAVLDDLERVLVEVATSPDAVGADALEALQKRIESQGLLFKVRVIDSQVRQREKAAVRAGARTSVS